MFALERRNHILEKLERQHRVTIKELSRELSVSEATLRTDLTKMEEDRLLKRTHGGAVLADESDTETSFSYREQKNRLEKSMIAKRAIGLLSSGQCIMLDASSTALEMARILKEMPIRLTVVTSGINTALELNNNPDITVILLGGIVKKGSHSLEGTLGVNILSQIHIDMMFTSANGFSIVSGLTDFSMYEVELKKSMINAANKVIALLDHTKMNKNSIAAFASTKDIDMIITDRQLPEGYEDELSNLKVKIAVVSNNPE